MTKFKVTLNDSPYEKGDIIVNGFSEFIVTDVYKMTWWKYLLSYLHIKRNWFVGYKFRIIKDRTVFNTGNE